MRKGPFSQEQLVDILHEADKASVAQVAKRHGVSDKRRPRARGMNADDVKRLRQLEQKNDRPKEMPCDRIRAWGI